MKEIHDRRSWRSFRANLSILMSLHVACKKDKLKKKTLHNIWPPRLYGNSQRKQSNVSEAAEGGGTPAKETKDRIIKETLWNWRNLFWSSSSYYLQFKKISVTHFPFFLYRLIFLSPLEICRMPLSCVCLYVCAHCRDALVGFRAPSLWWSLSFVVSC